MYVFTCAENCPILQSDPLLDGRIPKMQMPVFLDDASFPAKNPTTNYKVYPLPLIPMTSQGPVNIAPLRNTI